MRSYKEYVYTMLDGVVSVSRLKSGGRKSHLLQKTKVVPVLLLLFARLRQKWLARTSNVEKAASITITMPMCTLNCLMDAKLGIMYKTLTIWAAKLSGYTVHL